MRTSGWGAFRQQFKNFVLGCWAATFRQAACIRALVVNTMSALSWATSSITCSASTSGFTFSRLLTTTRSGNAFSSASRPFSCPRTQALVSRLCSCRNTTFSGAGLGLKMFRRLSSGSLPALAGSSCSSTAPGSATNSISFQIFARFSRTWLGVDWQASA